MGLVEVFNNGDRIGYRDSFPLTLLSRRLGHTSRTLGVFLTGVGYD